MRFDRLTLFLLVSVGCKSTIPTYTINYSEDLTVHRPELIVPANETGKASQMEGSEKFVPLSGSIKAELDSIAKVSLRENRGGRVVDGYVFQIYSGNSRDEANTVRKQAEKLFPSLKPKLSYRQPNFRVKAGKFTDPLEANRIFLLVKQKFPRALLIPDRFTLVYERTD